MDISAINKINPLTAIGTPVTDRIEQTQTIVGAVRAVNQAQLLGDDREMLFTRDQDTQKMVVRIVARSSGEVIEQIPPEQMLRILEDLRSAQKGTRKR